MCEYNVCTSRDAVQQIYTPRRSSHGLLHGLPPWTASTRSNLNNQNPMVRHVLTQTYPLLGWPVVPLMYIPYIISACIAVLERMLNNDDHNMSSFKVIFVALPVLMYSSKCFLNCFLGHKRFSNLAVSPSVFFIFKTLIIFTNR